MVVRDPARTVCAACLLVGQEGQHNVPGRAAALAQPLAHHREHHGVHILHVDGAAAPDAVPFDLAGERVHPPVRRVGGHHIEVAMNEQGRPGRILAGDPGKQACPFGMRLQQYWLDADLSKQGGNVLSRRALARTGVIARIRGVDPDQVAGQRGHLVASGAAGPTGRGWVVRHLAIVPPSAGAVSSRLPGSASVAVCRPDLLS